MLGGHFCTGGHAHPGDILMLVACNDGGWWTHFLSLSQALVQYITEYSTDKTKWHFYTFGALT